MKRIPTIQNPKLTYLLFSFFFLVSLQSFADIVCGHIEGFEFTNGNNSLAIEEGGVYTIDVLPEHFYINSNINGKSESVKYVVENLDSGKKYTIIENSPPYTFPAGNSAWNLGIGTFKLTATLYKYNFGFGKCDSKTIIFTLGDLTCSADAGTITADFDSVVLANGSAMLSATPDGNINIPSEYSKIYVLTSGSDLVIEQVNTESPDFTVDMSGLYTIHTLVYDGNSDSANFLDLGIVVPGTTTGVDVLTAVGNSGICASLDAVGAPITVEEEGACNAYSGTLYSKTPINCLSNGLAFISAKVKDAPLVPAGYEQLYVLTEAFSLTILNVSETPEFEVNQRGFYRIHSLVYNPNSLDLSIVVPGQTTGFDVVNLIKDNDICASLDVSGAVNLVIGSRWFCYFFNKFFRNGRTGKTDSSGKGIGNINLDGIVNNYSSYEAFKDDFILANGRVKFFPNPVVNTLKVNMEIFDDEVMNYSVIDISGRQVTSGSAQDLEYGTQTIDTSRLNAGMYLVQFTSEYRTITEKIIVKK